MAAKIGNLLYFSTSLVHHTSLGPMGIHAQTHHDCVLYVRRKVQNPRGLPRRKDRAILRVGFLQLMRRQRLSGAAGCHNASVCCSKSEEARDNLGCAVPGLLEKAFSGVGFRLAGKDATLLGPARRRPLFLRRVAWATCRHGVACRPCAWRATTAIAGSRWWRAACLTSGRRQRAWVEGVERLAIHRWSGSPRRRLLPGWRRW